MSRPTLTRRRAIGGLLATAAFGGSAGGASRMAGARPYDEVTGSGALRVALYRDNAPFSDDPDGKPGGIDVDLARKIAETLGVRPEIRIIEASETVDGDFRLALWRGDLAGSPLADLMLHAPADKMLAYRNEQVFLTPPYAEQRLSIAYRRGTVDGGFQDLQDIEGRPVAVEGTSPADALIAFASGGTHRSTLKHFRTFAEASAAFFAGGADFLAGSRAAIESAIASEETGLRDVDVKDLAGTGLVKPRWELCGAVRSDSRDLGYRIGEAIAALIAEGALQAIYRAHGASFFPPSGY